MLKEGKNEGKKVRTRSKEIGKSVILPSFLRDLGLSAWRSAWASVSTSGPIEDDRSRRSHKVAASHLGFEPLDGAAGSARRRAKKKACGGGEGEDKWPGRGLAVEAVEWRVECGSESGPRRTAPPWPSSSRARLELKIDSWKKG